MKKATLTVSFDNEKLDALNYYMEKKDADLRVELQDTVQKLYERYVPQATRDYIDDKLSREADEKRKPKHTARPAALSGSSDGPA